MPQETGLPARCSSGESLAMTIREILDAAEKCRVLVVGDVMLDHYIWGDATRISPEAPVPVVSVFRDSYAAGGAANVALNLADLGGTVCLAGLTGKDDAGSRLRETLGARRVTYLPGFERESVPTILKTRVMVQSQQLCRIDREASVRSYELDEPEWGPLLEEFARNVDAVILSDYGKGMISDGLIARIKDWTAQSQTILTLDPKPRRRLAFREVDLLTPNRSEALHLAGIELGLHDPFPAEEVCSRIWERHSPRFLVVTLGADGMLLSEKGEIVDLIPTCAREVFDVSGAGDTVIASLTLGLAVGAALPDAARFANLAAGVVVGKLGTATAASAEILAYQKTHPIGNG